MADEGTGGIEKTEFSPFLPLILAVCKRTERLVPARVRPNHITAASCAFAVASGVSAYLASFNRWWFAILVGCYFVHWFLDNLDGTLARARGLTSERGFFLDLFLDSVGYTALFTGAALAHYTSGFTCVALLIAVLLREQLMLHWMMLRRRFVMPLVGPSELPVIILLVVLLTVFWPRALLRIGDISLGWIDAAASLATLVYAVDIAVSFGRLYRSLEPPAR